MSAKTIPILAATPMRQRKREAPKGRVVDPGIHFAGHALHREGAQSAAHAVAAAVGQRQLSPTCTPATYATTLRPSASRL